MRLRTHFATETSYAARDGLQLEGILIRPLDAQAGRRYPLILYVHGGPKAHNSNGWLMSYFSPSQVAAADGYAVFYPNYRASTGRGVKFSRLDHADPAGKEFDDLLDAVDHLIGIGLVDGATAGVTGGSYGGYATEWCFTFYSERFAAGVMFVGISDLVSKYGTTEIPNELTLVHYRKSVLDDLDMFRERSPICHVEKARTSLLILDGKDDTRVPPGQSMRTEKLNKRKPLQERNRRGDGTDERAQRILRAGAFEQPLRLPADVLIYPRILRPHVLRHTGASRPVMRGGDLRIFREPEGWKSLKMFERYIHPSPEHKRQAGVLLVSAVPPEFPPSKSAKPVSPCAPIAQMDRASAF